MKSDSSKPLQELPPKIELIRNQTLVYPRREQDYQMLKALGAPLTHISKTMFPLLTCLLKRHKIEIQITPFSEIEKAALKRAALKYKWGLDYNEEQKAVTLSCPRKKIARLEMEALTKSLMRFYDKHQVQVESKTRRSKTQITTIIRRINNIRS